ncbi:MAG: hypothetical protein KGJ41_15835 [Rhodospirillales bacterium]|nr:hypothetical protein [Rhodospirillales bacterium]MDE2200485.1 hypothetical protein [Rhodospirillales bacterium]MDE2576995.1 hypothetical protein [Rhodospirillales bacterium]
MSRVSRLLASILLLGMVPAVPALAQHGADEGRPMRVITDTPEFCHRLAGEFAAEQRAALRPHPVAHDLALTGERMCGNGQIRPGIMRLRRALQILRRQE